MDKKIPLIFGVPQASFLRGFREKRVFVAELRPSLAGMKKTAPLFLSHAVCPVIICDNMLTFCIANRLVSAVHIFYHVFKDDKALCRCGSLIAALAARQYKVPVYLHRGAAMPLKSSSLLLIDGHEVTTPGIKTYVPVFEEVPLKLVKKGFSYD